VAKSMPDRLRTTTRPGSVSEDGQVGVTAGDAGQPGERAGARRWFSVLPVIGIPGDQEDSLGPVNAAERASPESRSHPWKNE
jgi:hypothetical protein